MKEDFCVITFYSTYLALKFERTVKNKGMEIKLIPVPRQISSSCGLAGKVNKGQIEEIKELCRENKIEFEHIYKIFQNRSKNIEIIS